MFARRTAWQSEPNRFTQALEARRRQNGELLDLTESNPTRSGFEYPPALLDALHTSAALDYAPEAQGMRSAREAVSAYYAARGDSVPPERLLLTTSTSEAYTWAFRLLCDPRDEVLVPAPSYPLFEYLASIQDVAPVRYPLFYDHGWQVDLHALEQAVTERTRAVLVVNPNNPTGSYLQPAELEAMNRLCSASGLALVADEVFLDFPHNDFPHNDFPYAAKPRPSLANNAAALTFTLSGLSKIAGLPQMKVAWMAVSGPAAQAAQALARLEVIADTYLSMNTPMQLALPALLASRSGFQKQLRERVQTNSKALNAALAAVPSVERLESEAGWYAVLRTPHTGSDEDLAIALLEEQGVVTHPGHFYDFRAEGYLVLSLITPAALFREGATRLATFLARRFR
ncbi:MAG: pyridoxal phosphate-dependent aminotransferase [Acidobacteriota bacterium]|nr:pyridoxal phosphate-dependent aminotransferase [Acidobacteriota bacterium]